MKGKLGEHFLRWLEETPATSGQEVIGFASAYREFLELPELREAAEGTGHYTVAMRLVKKLEDFAAHLESADAEERHNAEHEVRDLVDREA